jgi:hypothetical protein
VEHDHLLHTPAHTQAKRETLEQNDEHVHTSPLPSPAPTLSCPRRLPFPSRFCSHCAPTQAKHKRAHVHFGPMSTRRNSSRSGGIGAAPVTSHHTRSIPILRRIGAKYYDTYIHTCTDDTERKCIKAHSRLQACCGVCCLALGEGSFLLLS